jgi:hypothetical protein
MSYSKQFLDFANMYQIPKHKFEQIYEQEYDWDDCIYFPHASMYIIQWNGIKDKNEYWETPEIDVYGDYKRGDILMVNEWYGYRNTGKYVWNGEKGIQYDTDRDDYGNMCRGYNVPEEFHPKYWNVSLDGMPAISHNNVIWTKWNKEIGNELRKRMKKVQEEGRRRDIYVFEYEGRRYGCIMGKYGECELNKNGEGYIQYRLEEEDALDLNVLETYSDCDNILPKSILKLKEEEEECMSYGVGYTNMVYMTGYT